MNWAQVQKVVASKIIDGLTAFGIPLSEIGDDLASASFAGGLFLSGSGIDSKYPEVSHYSTLGHHAIRWVGFGMPVFKMTASLAASAVLTKCSGLNGRDLRFPFGSFLIEMPEFEELSFTSPDGEMERVKEIIVHRFMNHPNASEALLEASSILEDRRNISEFRRLVDERTNAKRPWVHIELQGARSSVYTGDFEPSELSSLEQWIDSPRNMNACNEVDMQALRLAARIVTNLCVYLDGSECDYQEPAQTINQARVNIARGPRRYCVGRDVVISDEARAAARTAARSGNSADAAALWKLQSRFVVRGHWRNQPCGEGRQGRRWKWIAPYWKGPTGAEALNRAYRCGSGGSHAAP